jgi:hypothetical protein
MLQRRTRPLSQPLIMMSVPLCNLNLFLFDRLLGIDYQARNFT